MGSYSARLAPAILALVLLALPRSFAETAELSLSGEERAWLKAHPGITVVQDPYWPPVEFADERGVETGITSDYLAIVEQRLGIRFKRLEGIDWQEAYDRLARWDIDMTTSVTPTPDRLGFWAFTKPYMTVPIVIVTRADVTYISSISDLAGKKLALVDGYAVSEWIPRDYPATQLVRVKNAIEGLRAVEDGTAFAFIDNMLVVGFYMAKEGITGLKIAGGSPYKNELSMAVRKDWAPLAGMLQKALDSITEAEKAEIYDRWVPIRYEHGFDYAVLWRFVAAASALVLFLAVWIFLLRREIRLRKASEGRLKLHLLETPAAVIEWDRDYRVAYWNPAAERIFGYSASEAMGRRGDFICDPEDRERIEASWLDMMAEASSSTYSCWNLAKDGHRIRCSWINTSLCLAGIGEAWVVSIALDVTKQTRDEERLLIALKERESLIRELYHRTRNSLNVISSMLQLQAMASDDEKYKAMVRSAVSRILTMALTHEKLIESGDLSRIELGDYLKEVAESTIGDFRQEGLEISLAFDADRIKSLIDVAQPCGLVVNELTANACMHAFRGRSSGSIALSLRRREGGFIEIEFADDGVGLEPGRDLEMSGGLGIDIAFAIAREQLGADIRYESAGGLRWKIRFDERLYSERLEAGLEGKP